MNFAFFSSNMRQVLQDAFLGKKWQSANGNTYMILYVFMFEGCEQWNCSWEMLQYSSRNALYSSSSTRSYMYLLLQNRDFLLMSLPKTLKKDQKKGKQKTSHIKFKKKGNKLSIGRLVHTLLKSYSYWSLSELFDVIKHGHTFFTDKGNLAFYFFGKSVLVFALSHQGASRTAECCNIMEHFSVLWTHVAWWFFVL